MDMKALLDDVLKNGKDWAEKGQSYAEEKLNVPAEGEKRDAAISGMKTGAIAAGVLALLVGTKTGRQVSGVALKAGSIAALGGLAWKAYSDWSGKQEVENATSTPPALPVSKLEGKEADERSVILLKAMLAAAKADGEVDEEEQKLIEQQIQSMGLEGEVSDMLKGSLVTPLSASAVARMAEGDQAIAAEIYLVSSIVAGKDNIQEKLYMDSLAKALGLPDDLVEQLEAAQK